jgi:hypothetical protein
MSTNGSSTLSDVVIGVTLREIYGLPTTIRSIRSAGVNAAIVILADSVSARIIADSIPRIVDGCGVLVLDVGIVDEAVLGPAWRVKWHLAHDFLAVSPYRFGRVLFVDPYDTFLQGDPFGDAVDPGKIYFASEAITLKDARMGGWSWEGIEEVVDNETWHTQGVIAPTPVLGGVKGFLALCSQLFLRRKEQGTAHSEVVEINLMVLGARVTPDVAVEVVPFCGFMASVAMLAKRAKPIFDSKSHITCNEWLQGPAVIAQYNGRVRGIGAQVRAVCAQGEIQWAFKIE